MANLWVVLEPVYLLVYIISPDECEDMYETCPEMKKNFYCTNYTDLMKIQCKKSCGFCGKIDFPCNCFSKGRHRFLREMTTE